MFVYSGKCRFCEIGIKTTLKDDCDNILRTGDIVMSYSVTEDFGAVSFDGLTVVVADHFENIVGREPIEKADKGEPFIMGIKSSKIDKKIEKYPNEVWRVKRLKKYEDVIDGEHWTAFGFNYKSN